MIENIMTNIIPVLYYQIRTEQNKSNLQNFKTANFWVYTSWQCYAEVTAVIRGAFRYHLRHENPTIMIFGLHFFQVRTDHNNNNNKKKSSFFAFYFPSNFPSFPGIPDENHSSIECLIFRGLIWRIFMWFCWLAFSVSVLVSL